MLLHKDPGKSGKFWIRAIRFGSKFSGGADFIGPIQQEQRETRRPVIRCVIDQPRGRFGQLARFAEQLPARRVVERLSGRLSGMKKQWKRIVAQWPDFCERQRCIALE